MAPPPLRQYASTPALPSGQVTEDTPADLLEGDMNLTVILPAGHHVTMRVDRRWVAYISVHHTAISLSFTLIEYLSLKELCCRMWTVPYFMSLCAGLVLHKHRLLLVNGHVF